MDTIDQGLAVKDLLRIPHFKDAVLLGGQDGLDQFVSRVNVMEVPDVVDWVRPGEFLMTTGYPFRQEPEILEKLIEELARKGIVALGIKTKRYIDKVPLAAVQAANHFGLPLIELPPSTTFSDVVREVMERVLVQESRQLSILQNRVQRLSHVLLHGDGLSSFLCLLESFVGNPVVLLDRKNRWMASPEGETFCKQLEASDWEQLRQDSPLEISLIAIDGKSIRVHCSSVMEGAEPYLLLLLESFQECNIVDTLTLNWASKFVGFEISNAQARKKIEAKYIDQFLQDWISGRIVMESDLKLRAEACGCPLNDHTDYRIGVVSFQEKRPELQQLQEMAKRLNWDQTEFDLRWTVLEEQLVVISSIERGGSKEQAEFRKEAESILKELRPMLVEYGDFQLCLGRRTSEQSKVSESYREAKRAAEVGRVCHFDKDVVYYEELGTYLLLYRLVSTDEAKEFQQNYLKPLLDYDRRSTNPGMLIKTLKMYFACNGNIKETAERMFLHYNTVMYRLERIKNEIGIPLDEAETRLQLQLAIKLHEMKEI